MIPKHGLFLGKARLATGFTVLLLAMIFSLTGCPTDDDEESPVNKPQNVTSIQVYTLSGTTFTSYPGTGAAQTVTGSMTGDEWVVSLGNIGTISADGKLTLNLPETVEDSKLQDVPNYDVKYGNLKTTPLLRLYSGNESLTIQYLNKAISEGDVNLKKGWNYILGSTMTLVTDISACKWVISQ